MKLNDADMLLVILGTLGCADRIGDSGDLDPFPETGLEWHEPLSLVHDGRLLSPGEILEFNTAPAGVDLLHTLRFTIHNISDESIDFEDGSGGWMSGDIFRFGEVPPQNLEAGEDAQFTIEHSPKDMENGAIIDALLTVPGMDMDFTLRAETPPPLRIVIIGDGGFSIYSDSYGRDFTQSAEIENEMQAKAIAWGKASGDKEGRFLRNFSVTQNPEAPGMWEYSSDGIHWEEANHEQNFSASDCAHGMNRFACVRTDTLSWSTDGLFVEHEESLMDFKLNAITAMTDRFVAVGRGGRRVISLDGQTWADENFSGDSDNYNGIAHNGQTIVAVGGINRFYLSYSLDGGENWSDTPFGNCEGNSLKSIVWNRGIFMAQGESDCHHNMHRSPDGVNWEPVIELHPFDRYDLLGAHNGWFFGHKTEGDGSVGVYRSEDGAEWTLVHSLPAGTQLRKMSAEQWEIQ